MKLTEKYELLEKIDTDKKVLYKARNLFEETDIFIEKYKETDASDWNEGANINKELKNLKTSGKIDDYFYIDNKKKKTRLFFKVYNENPLVKKKETVPKRKRRDGIIEEKKLSSLDLKNVKEEKNEKSVRNRHLKKKNLVSTKKERIVVCEVCRHEIRLRNYNALTNTGYCDYCKRERNVKYEEKKNLKQRAKGSKRIKVKKTKNRLLIEISKGKMDLIGLLIVMFAFGLYLLPGAPYVAYIFYAGLVVILSILIMEIKFIDVSKGAMRLYSKPFSITPMKKIKAKDIEQIYVKRKKTKDVASEMAGEMVKYFIQGNNRRRHRNVEQLREDLEVYYLVAKLKNDKGEIGLLKTNSKEDALYIEKTIETFLNIKDEKMHAEVEY